MWRWRVPEADDLGICAEVPYTWQLKGGLYRWDFNEVIVNY
jgi:hypothetical protein